MCKLASQRQPCSGGKKLQLSRLQMYIELAETESFKILLVVKNEQSIEALPTLKHSEAVVKY